MISTNFQFLCWQNLHYCADNSSIFIPTSWIIFPRGGCSPPSPFRPNARGLLTVRHLKQTTINMMKHYTYWKTAKLRLFRQDRVLIFKEYYIRFGCRVLCQPEVCIRVNRSTIRHQRPEFTLHWPELTVDTRQPRGRAASPFSAFFILE